MAKIVNTGDPGSDLSEAPEDYLRRTGDDRVVVLPKDDELFIDIDGEEAQETFDLRLKTFVDNGMVCRIMRDTPSRTEGHRHIVVKLGRDITPTERIALQACLGSDRKRELLSLLRIMLDMKRAPTVFFEEAELGDDI